MQAAGLVNDHTTDCFRHPSKGKSRATREKTRQSQPLTIRVKRIYESPAPEDGYRVLVDRLWPRGLAKESAALDLWLQDVAPSTALRKWFNHDASRWQEFTGRYTTELDQQPEAVETIKRFLRKGRLTLLFSAKDQKHNNAVALKAYLEMSE
jgi:uncharacterized protein YeaO (DUF488 family)